MFKNFDENYEVCNCVKITIKDIKESISQKGVKSLRDLQEITKAGTECRHCLMSEGDFGKVKKKVYCKAILGEFCNV